MRSQFKNCIPGRSDHRYRMAVRCVDPADRIFWSNGSARDGYRTFGDFEAITAEYYHALRRLAEGFDARLDQILTHFSF